jgi:hypothetical protein
VTLREQIEEYRRRMRLFNEWEEVQAALDAARSVEVGATVEGPADPDSKKRGC